MKRIWIYIALFLPLAACDDLLDVTCETGVTYQNYFKAEADVEAVIITMLSSENVTDPTAMEMSALPCTNFFDEGYRTLDVGTYLNPYLNFEWSMYYRIIYLANMLEDNRFRFENISKERIDFWLGQANFMKALAYLRLAQMWGEAPVPNDSEETEARAKSPVKEVLEEAVRSAEKALNLPTHDKLVDSRGNVLKSKQYASLGSVNTLLANIYAWMGGLFGETKYWEKAEEFASNVIDGRAGHYEMEPSIELLLTNTLGKVRDSDETIFCLEKSKADYSYEYQSSISYLYPGVMLENYPYITSDASAVIKNFPDSRYYRARITVEDVKKIYPEETDVRRSRFWYNLGEVKYSKVNTETGETEEVFSPYAYLIKWKDLIRSEDEYYYGRVLDIDANRVVWRLADLRLLRAECRTYLSGKDAIVDLNKVRDRAGLNEYTGSEDAETLRREIFNERQRELFGEGHRYYDIVRNGYLEQLGEAYQALTPQDINNGALYLPVSKNAFKLNELMKQNVYWSWRK